MPPITDPFGDPIDLPNLPLPDFSQPSLYPPNDGDGVDGGNDGPPKPEEPGDMGEAEEPEETEEGGEAGRCMTDKWLQGIAVEITAAPGNASGFQTEAGFVYTEAAFVYLGAEAQMEYYEESARVLASGQYFPARDGYNCWHVVCAPFYKAKITEYTKPIEESE
jgi:hypothetical protein